MDLTYGFHINDIFSFGVFTLFRYRRRCFISPSSSKTEISSPVTLPPPPPNPVHKFTEISKQISVIFFSTKFCSERETLSEDTKQTESR
jgi:hypothetical protein